ncbi:conserved exported hypothetical protein [Rubrivivax sp. A210]|uniref:ShlB/FhaC/HecB family hemolysin secretion/activation protein n=1 Tax=Rubrivivax sp. A210 TaxID=2772301 RepID=UPI001918C51E|nr:ShlB/FhaC/HecB family hemolysin secretion/activation protein [Rubrivivax sp. A210]CAD5367123.1 conserved exported hypothetical protein [Rubrivivax sp. A210]
MPSSPAFPAYPRQPLMGCSALTRPALQLPALAALAALLLAAPAWAQTAPSAGQLLDEVRRSNTPALPMAPPPRLIEAPVRPTINLPEGASVAVSSFRIVGAVSFPAEELAALVAPWAGKRLDIAGLNEAAGAITRRYQSAGHLLSYAYLPAQRVADGVIELAVLEGRIEGVQVVTAQDARLRDEVVQAHTERLTAPGPVRQADVERQLLLLNDIPGVTARAAFTPGASTGAADVVVSVAEDEPLEVRADVSNHGTRATGTYRAGLSLQFRDLFGWGDTSTARALVSERGSLISGSLNTSVPVGGDGYKIGASLSRLKYQLSGRFRDVGAVGSADVIGVDASYPFLRSAEASIAVKASIEHRRLSDAKLEEPIPARLKTNDVFELSSSFDVRDSLGGASAGSVTASMGHLDQDVGAAGWRKVGALAARQQALFGPWSLYGRVAAQYTGSNLDSSEKFGLAGPGAVRAYASGETSVDLGALGSLELRHAQDLLGGSVVLSAFHDLAYGRIDRSTQNVAGNRVRLSGSGLGLAWYGGGLGLNASLAWPGKLKPTVDPGVGQPRLFLQLSLTP